MFVLKIIFIVSFVVFSKSYKILGVVHMPTKSQNKVATKFFSHLAEIGHEVTLVKPTPDESTIKNLKVVIIDSPHKLMAGKEKQFLSAHNMTYFEKNSEFFEYVVNFTKCILEDKKFHEILQNNETYDAVIIWQYMSDAFYPLSQYFKTPLILMSSMPLYPFEAFSLSHILQTSYVINISSFLKKPMNFWDRVKNFIFDVYSILSHRQVFLPQLEKIASENIPGRFDFYQSTKDVSLLLLNSHLSVNEIVPQIPNTIQIGGCHLAEPKLLPQDLKKFLDGSVNGVIVFSMGTLIKSYAFAESKKHAIIKVFAKFKQNVLWKYENDQLPTLPENVKIMRWLPQSDVLAHPNVKAFIGQGGILSTIETIYHGKPMIAIPIFADQFLNSKVVVSYGCGIVISYIDLNEHTLTSGLNQILKNSTYEKNAKKLSKIIKDRPIHPLDLAGFGVNHVIKHKGARHLRYPGQDVQWYEMYLLDVIAILLIFIFLLILFLSKIIFLLDRFVN